MRSIAIAGLVAGVLAAITGCTDLGGEYFHAKGDYEREKKRLEEYRQIVEGKSRTYQVILEIPDGFDDQSVENAQQWFREQKDRDQFLELREQHVERLYQKMLDAKRKL